MNNFPTILHALTHHAKTNPEKTAIIEAQTGKKCTYGELWAYVMGFSKQLKNAGVVKDLGDGYGSRVTVRCSQTIEYITSCLAVFLCGGVLVPVEKKTVELRIIEIMQETDSNIIIDYTPLQNYQCTFFPLEDAVKDHNTTEDDILLPNPNALALIIFTTGTTGKSKGVMHSHKSFTAWLLSNYNADDQIWLISVPLNHIAGMSKVFSVIYFLDTAVLIDGFTMSNLYFSAVSQYKVTSLNMPAAQIEFYLRTCRDKMEEICDQIIVIGFGASTLEKPAITELKKIFKNAKLRQGYGATETGGFYVDHAQGDYDKYCIGQPVQNTEYVFFDEQKEKIIDASKDNPGLIGIKSDTAMQGYWKNPELTASITRGGYIVLSDFSYKGEDGLCYFVSRADDVIVSGGYKISPLDVEDAANSFYGIKESVCIPVTDPIMGFVPKLFVVMNDEYEFNAAEIMKHLREKLEVKKLPRFVEEIDEIPKINNKINRKELLLSC